MGGWAGRWPPLTRIVGLSPRRLARLLRVERLVEAIDIDGDVSWADLAAGGPEAYERAG
jgi:hypothetical protein